MGDGLAHRNQDEIILRNHHVRRQSRRIVCPFFPLEHQLLNPLRRSKVTRDLLLTPLSLPHVRVHGTSRIGVSGRAPVRARGRWCMARVEFVNFKRQLVRFDVPQRTREPPTCHAKIAKNVLDESLPLPYGSVSCPILPLNGGLASLCELQQFTKAQCDTICSVLVRRGVAHLDSSRNDDLRRARQERRLWAARRRRRGLVERRFARV
jgi:hypothetical protein